MSVKFTLQRIYKDAALPVTKKDLTKVISKVFLFLEIDPKYTLTIRIVDELESQTLNFEYRNKNKPTNVLSFPSSIIDLPSEVQNALSMNEVTLGDLVICLPVVLQEAREQAKIPTHHLIHLLIHGVLHLYGYDHETEEDAYKMEQIEIAVLSSFNILNPYL